MTQPKTLKKLLSLDEIHRLGSDVQQLQAMSSVSPQLKKWTDCEKLLHTCVLQDESVAALWRTVLDENSYHPPILLTSWRFSLPVDENLYPRVLGLMRLCGTKEDVNFGTAGFWTPLMVVKI